MRRSAPRSPPAGGAARAVGSRAARRHAHRRLRLDARPPTIPRSSEYLPPSAPTTTRRAERLSRLADRLAAESAEPDPGRRRRLGRLAARRIHLSHPDARGQRQSAVSSVASRGDPEQVLLDDNLVGETHRVRRRGGPRAQPRRGPARLVGGHQRRRDLRAADQGPGYRRGPAGGHRPHAIRGWPGRADSRYLFYLVPDELQPAVPGVAPPRRHAGDRRRAGAGARPTPRFELTLQRPRAAASWRSSPSASRDTTEVRLIPLRRPAGRPGAGPAPAARHRVPRSITREASMTGQALVRRHRRRRARVHADAGAAGRPGPGRTGSRSAALPSLRPAPTPGCFAATCSAEHLLLTLRRDGEPLLAITDHDGGQRPRAAASAPRRLDPGRSTPRTTTAAR